MNTLKALLVTVLMSALVAGTAITGQEERSEQLEFESNYFTDDD